MHLVVNIEFLCLQLERLRDAINRQRNLLDRISQFNPTLIADNRYGVELTHIGDESRKLILHWLVEHVSIAVVQQPVNDERAVKGQVVKVCK